MSREYIVECNVFVKKVSLKIKIQHKILILFISKIEINCFFSVIVSNYIMHKLNKNQHFLSSKITSLKFSTKLD